MGIGPNVVELFLLPARTEWNHHAPAGHCGPESRQPACPVGQREELEPGGLRSVSKQLAVAWGAVLSNNGRRCWFGCRCRLEDFDHSPASRAPERIRPATAMMSGWSGRSAWT